MSSPVTPASDSPGPQPESNKPLAIGLAVWLVVTGALGWLSAWLKGNDGWKFVALVAGVGLVATIGMEIKDRGDRLTRGEKIGMVCGVVTWVVWFLPGFLFAGHPLSYQHDLDTPARFLYDGDTVATADGQETIDFRVRNFDEKKLRLEVLTPDGWARRDFTLEHDPHYNTDTPHQQVKPAALNVITVWVDNRGGEKARLECGKVEMVVAAGEHRSFRFPRPERIEQTPFHIDGRDSVFLAREYYLIDMLGTRTYRLRERVYRGASIVPKEPGPDVELSGKRIHPLDKRIDYFLEKAPDTIEQSRLKFPEDVVRTELLEKP